MNSTIRPLAVGCACLIALAGAATCSTSDGSGPEGAGSGEGSGTGDTTGAGGSAGGIDATGDVVILPDGAVVPAATLGCKSDDECEGPGEVCACDGSCIVPEGAPCTEPKNCGAPTWCNPCTGYCETTSTLCEPCKPVKVCDGEGSCKPAEGGPCRDLGLCLDFASGGSFCTQGCIGDAGCPPAGYECIEVSGSTEKQCKPTSGTCEDLGLCTSDDECGDDEICGPLGSCAPGCSGDEVCPLGNVCTQGHCGPACVSDTDCEAPKACDPSGHCLIPGACLDSAGCEPEHYCKKSTGECIPGCLSDAHCQDASKECHNGVCEAKGCEHNYQCAFEENCEKTSGGCEPMTRPHCAACDASSQDAGQCGGEEHLCVTFQDQDGNEQGDFCLLECLDEDPIDRCPQGYSCDHIQSDDGSIDGFYCTRQCPDAPI